MKREKKVELRSRHVLCSNRPLNASLSLWRMAREDTRAWRLSYLLCWKRCCYRHLCSLLQESVGLPFSTLADVNFLYCPYCRHKDPQNNTESPSTELAVVSSSSSVAGPSPSPSLLDAYFREYSAAVASKALKRALRASSPAHSLKRSKGSHVRPACIKGEISDHDAEEEEDAKSMAPAETSTIESIPAHLLFGDAVLSHLPLCDIARARLVSRAWMTNIDLALRNPTSRMHPCLHHPCLMLLNPASEKIGACACLYVYDIRLNSWLPNPILFPNNASFLVGVSHGLFCFATGNPFINSNVDFFVGNPLTHTWTCLPHHPMHEHVWFVTLGVAFVAHVAGSKGLGYKLFKLICAGQKYDCDAVFLIYDSHKRDWDVMGNNGEVTVPCDMVEHTVLEDSGLVHFINMSMSHFWSYDVHTNKFQENHLVQDRPFMIARHVHALQPKKGQTDIISGLPCVVKCAERLFRVYRMQQRPENEAEVVGLIPLICHSCPVGIGRLEDNTRWEIVSEMPPNLLKEAVEEGSDGTDFVIGSDSTQHIFFILRGSSKMLAYDVLSSVWETLPGCPIGHSFYPYRLRAFYQPLMGIEPLHT